MVVPVAAAVSELAGSLDSVATGFAGEAGG